MHVNIHRIAHTAIGINSFNFIEFVYVAQNEFHVVIVVINVHRSKALAQPHKTPIDEAHTHSQRT